MSSETYQQWCRGIRRSDREAFERLFYALHDALHRYAVSIAGEEAAARDIVQETFVQLWERRDTLDPQRSVRALLFRMVRNRAYNHERDRRRREELLRKEGDVFRNGRPDAPDGRMRTEHLDGLLKKWIDALPERQREALILSRYEGLSHQEVAAVMDISPRTVNNHLVRALKTLRGQVSEYEPELLES